MEVAVEIRPFKSSLIRLWCTFHRVLGLFIDKTAVTLGGASLTRDAAVDVRSVCI